MIDMMKNINAFIEHLHYYITWHKFIQDLGNHGATKTGQQACRRQQEVTIRRLDRVSGLQSDVLFFKGYAEDIQQYIVFLM
jgi:hypothetical protein